MLIDKKETAFSAIFSKNNKIQYRQIQLLCTSYADVMCLVRTAMTCRPVAKGLWFLRLDWV